MKSNSDYPKAFVDSVIKDDLPVCLAAGKKVDHLDPGEVYLLATSIAMSQPVMKLKGELLRARGLWNTTLAVGDDPSGEKADEAEKKALLDAIRKIYQ
jgi:hypothetical protein